MHHKDYSLYFKFIEKYAISRFREIDGDDPLVLEMEKMMDLNKQFIYVGDVINMKIEFTSKGCYDNIGIRAEDFNPHLIFSITHPDDMQRHGVTRSRMVKQANDLYVKGKGSAVLSTNLRLKNALGTFTNFFMQGFMWFSKVPVDTVWCLFINTDISWFGEIKHGHNSYFGHDMSYLRYPDKDLILTGNIFSDREFEILKLLEQGFKSQEIAEKIFLSVHTVNTHRRRILRKTGCKTMSQLIHDLKEKGTL